MKAAALGDWQDFLQTYLPPICGELARLGKRYGIYITDQDDLRQDLMLRLMTPRFTNDIPLPGNQEPTANLVGRYLTQPGVEFRNGRFRAYLRGIIRNVVLESLRRRSQIRDRVVPWDDEAFAAVFEESLTHALDREWIGSCLEMAAAVMRKASTDAKTKARKREFDILCLSLIDHLSLACIANRYRLDENTTSRCLHDAREHFVQHLERLTGILPRSQLKKAVAEIPDRLVNALKLARAAPDHSPEH